MAEAGVPTEVQALIALFEQELHGVKFADLDVGVLRASAEALKARQDELAEAESRLERASVALEAESDGLLKKAQRAHAYLRIYADTTPGLIEKVDAISLPRGRRSNTPSAAATPPVQAAMVTDPAAQPPAPKRTRRKSLAASLFDESTPAPAVPVAEEVAAPAS